MTRSLDTVLLSRIQFGFTTAYHILWPTLTVGLSIFLVIMEILWLATGDNDWYRHIRFWSKLFLLNFSVGVATGLVMEFQFGTNWEPFTQAAGGFFGNILGLEGTLAFMLEAGFLGIMIFGWAKVPRALHLLSTILVAAGGSLSAFWILVANSWMQTPAGGHFVDGRFILDSFRKAVFNPDTIVSVPHMWNACVVTTCFVVGGISAWYILRGDRSAFFLKTLRIAFFVSVVATPLQIYLGDAQGLAIVHEQPAKLAAMEAHWQTNPPGTPAGFNLIAWPDRQEQRNVFSIQIPYLLSILETRTVNGQVTGLKDFPREDQPPVVIPFFAFRIMVLIGLLFFSLMAWTFAVWIRNGLGEEGVRRRTWLMRAWLWSLPLGYLAVEMGWFTREEGRQPWVIYGILRTSNAASNLPAGAVVFSLAAFFVVYAGIAVLFLVFAGRILRAGPDLAVNPPRREEQPAPLDALSSARQGTSLEAQESEP